ncbi:MAG: pitrilysin family protein [Candidatus Woesearchaeota archaeon]|jgi:predicted Zn-dependent peptidase|nr:pitrilysin family protein [Candidatus Woesearchaeota archaeon]MDP7323516.1 pitrilysin family protein [Candidatus Woesearchaeota archaeon]MDP7457509.1 pitrilysin family protein [Candidatus Woesearchaeota archaeon]
MKKIILSNGLTVILYPTSTQSIAIQATVKVGSNHESNKFRGISHFVEHLLFEGTKKRSGQQIADTIEGSGGSLGAFTTNSRTAYYMKVIQKHFPKAIDVLLDMLSNPLFDPKVIEKERSIILSEVKMRQDEPRSYQWELFQKTLFNSNNAKHPIIGYKKNVQSITRSDLINHFKKYYIPSNIILTASGAISKQHEKLLIKCCSKLSQGKKLLPLKETIEKPLAKNKELTRTREMQHSYLVLGYHTVPRNHEDNYIIEVIQAILGRPLSGRLFRKIRQEKALCYDIGAHNEDESTYGFFALYLSTNKKSLNQAKKLLLQEINHVDKINKTEFQQVKNYIEGDYLLTLEDNERRADELGFCEYIGDLNSINTYVRNIKKVTVKDITRVKKKYLKKYAQAILKEK